MGSTDKQANAMIQGEFPQTIDVMMDMTLFHCVSCRLPLKPPVFQCQAAAHVVCSQDYCRQKHGQHCSRTDVPSTELDAIVASTKVPCVYRGLGCGLHVVYHDAENHLRVCPHAPCSCPVPSCVFLGAPTALLEHLAADNALAIVTVKYGQPSVLTLPLSQPWHVVAGHEDRSVFLVSLGELSGGAAMGVSLVCVRGHGNAVAGPQYWCKITVDSPAGRDDNSMVPMMACTVTSSALAGGAPMPWQDQAGQGMMYLAVPREAISSGETLALSVQINRL